MTIRRRFTQAPEDQTRRCKRRKTYSTRFPSAENPVPKGQLDQRRNGRMDWANVGRRLHRLVWYSGACVKRRRIVILTLPDFVPQAKPLGSAKPEKRSLQKMVALRLREQSCVGTRKRPEMKLLSMFPKREGPYSQVVKVGVDRCRDFT